ncbi:MAG: outer membrane beta-barrel protein [Flavobacteriales bacterium]|nr:outer membrane beta-barrel protein [Flavobacteriales bacterium]
MKNLLTLILALTTITSLYAQKRKSHHGVSQITNLYIDFGPKAMIGTSGFVNMNVLGDDNYNHGIAASYGFGGKLAIDFGESIALVGEGIFTSVTQKFTITEDNGDTWNKSIKLTSIDIPMMFRKNNAATGSYVELGPQISLLKGVSESGYNTSINNKDYFKSSYWSAVFGFGGYLYGAGNLGVSSGLRFVYTFQDIDNQNNTGSFESDSYHGKMLSYDEYSTTTPLSVFFVLEINYDLGFIIAKNECTGRRKFLFYN